ncbi:MAG: MarR family transcriptional regulator [Sphaerochaetaceae bacterium]
MNKNIKIEFNKPLLDILCRLRFLRVNQLFSKLDLHPAQGHLLILIEQKEGLSQQELASILMIKPPSLTVMLKRMENKKLIERRIDSFDARILRVYKTEKGDKVLLEVKSLLKQLETETFKELSLEQKATFEKLAETIKKSLLDSIGENKDYVECFKIS